MTLFPAGRPIASAMLPEPLAVQDAPAGAEQVRRPTIAAGRVSATDALARRWVRRWRP
jgi:hypothetical protein